MAGIDVNRTTTGNLVNAPFGGMKNSSTSTFRESGRVGLEFKYPIDEAAVLVNLKPATAKPTQRFRRPAIREGVSEQERKLASATQGKDAEIDFADHDKHDMEPGSRIAPDRSRNPGPRLSRISPRRA